MCIIYICILLKSIKHTYHLCVYVGLKKQKSYFLRVIPTLKHSSDIVSDILEVYMAYLFWHSILSGILSRKYADSLSDILSGIYSDILSGIYSAIVSDILSGISSGILCGRGPAGVTFIQRLLFGSGGDHCDLALAVEVRRRRRRRRPADIKSNNPHLTAGAKMTREATELFNFNSISFSQRRWYAGLHLRNEGHRIFWLPSCREASKGTDSWYVEAWEIVSLDSWGILNTQLDRLKNQDTFFVWLSQLLNYQGLRGGDGCPVHRKNHGEGLSRSLQQYRIMMKLMSLSQF